MNEQAREVLDFWFGPTDSEAFGKPREVWFKKDDAFDQALRDRYAQFWEQARAGALSDWNASPRELLAFVIVCDQFPRNMFRGDARSFTTDPLALDAARRMLGRGWTNNCCRSRRHSPICRSNIRKIWPTRIVQWRCSGAIQMTPC